MQQTPTSVRSGLRRSRWAALIALFAVVSLAAPALAVTGMMGNDASDRRSTENWPSATIIDRHHPAPFDGYFTRVDLYVMAAGSLNVVVVDAFDTVTWISDPITTTGPGAVTLQLLEPVGVTAGSNLGVYADGASILATGSGTVNAMFENAYSGLPTVGEPLTYYTTGRPRMLSIGAEITATSKDICKKGGWEGYGYKNQGQCIASVVANKNSGH
ncbi:hypothetical protein [Ornithinimicrobium cryptoxanthini]|uniref:hypothetical protein n=1 Tax=Ornithinimicrobium cryptoxanthini TaxID=2934161 RepID=UPI0021177EAE|nr:hypothetical protein [Ornithinimicrobium cryptoxanthini]